MPSGRQLEPVGLRGPTANAWAREQSAVEARWRV